ncbi:hypothetical protein C922_05456 [Plasmodium inui San Antonio 1]|uniref:Uncharacterized protein n=1 Tax=Plasmodium inui San Antonio 1 TaxID=1237626 RepID=W7A4Y1_9APIC|nr:hypothetical protein C922_05456 [Plasmodium inui San Antonio 1]EUD64164.1 hypothetical protein C922_05456 [Plasmodium inui San Antonio 1]
MGIDAHNCGDVYKQKHQWDSLEHKYSYISDMFKENNSSFDKVIKLYQKEIAYHVIYETTDNPSGTRCHKGKREVHNHEVCVLTDEELHTEVLITLSMMLLYG